MPGVPINDGNDVRAPRYLDLREGKIASAKSVPWGSAEEALAGILSTRRCDGLRVKIRNGDMIEDWEFNGGIADENFVKRVESGGTDTNFANTDLTADGDRIHDFAGHTATIKGLSEFNLTGTNQVITVPYVDGHPPFFAPNFDGTNDALILADTSNETLQVILNVDGVDTDPVTFTKTDIGEGNYGYIAPKQTGTTVTCVSYSGNFDVPPQVVIDSSNSAASTILDFSNRAAGTKTLKFPDADTNSVIAVGVTDGTTTEHAGNNGIVDISEFLNGGATIETGGTGTFEPTLTKNTNLSQASYAGSYYTVINNIVTIMVSFVVYSTAPGFCSLWLTLPTAYVTFGDCGSGSFFNSSTKDLVPAKVDVKTDVGGAEIVFNLPNTGEFRGAVMFMYPITF